MNKRIICVLMALVLASLGCAFAETVPSVTVADVVTVTEAVSSTGVPLPADFAVNVAPQNETSTALIAEIAEFVKSAPVAEFFGNDVAMTIATQLPEGTDVSALKLSELQPMVISNYDEACGDVVMTVSAAVEYADGAAVVALAGISGETGIVWYPLEASVTGGKVEVKFTQEVLTAAAGNEICFALLSAE